jgi:hypothetical protein
MATVTPNFNWPVPTSTDLVKDGATAIEALGDSIDGSLVDLKGGTTGQVLSKTSGTDMDFTWVTTDDANAIQNSIVDAKGDLIAASANDTPARLAVGNNGETLVADSSATTGLRYTGGTVISNPLINSCMDIWQRGTSIANTALTIYTADRWVTVGSAAAFTISRQATSDTTNLPNVQYCARIQRNSGQTNTAGFDFLQGFETTNSIPYAGKTVTMSFYARAGANYSPTSSILQAQLYSGTGTDQSPTAAFTGQATVINQNATLTTTWQRFTYTASIGATATQLKTIFSMAPTGTAGANDYYEITGVQLDIGSVALPVRRNGATIQGELAACKRYLPSISVPSTSSTVEYFIGYAALTNTSVFAIPLDVQARVSPTGITTSGTIQAVAGNTPTNVTPSFDSAGVNSVGLTASHTITQGQGSRLTIPVGGSILFTGCEL